MAQFEFRQWIADIVALRAVRTIRLWAFIVVDDAGGRRQYALLQRKLLCHRRTYSWVLRKLIKNPLRFVPSDAVVQKIPAINNLLLG